MSRVLPQPLMSLAILALWIAIAPAPSLGQVVLGGVVALVIPWFTHPFWPDAPRLVRPWVAMRLFLRVLWDIVVANVEVARLVLTASGGPFRGWAAADLESVTPEQAGAHPTWNMGPMNTLNSASLVNKGLELIEAAYLFDVPEPQIEVLVHPQSIIHSLVEYDDGSVLAQLGLPDMRTPISYALSWPARMPLPGRERLDLAKIGRLDFLPPDPQRFPALRLARTAVSEGGGAPIVLNGANEVAVAAFLQRRIGFLAIATVAEQVLEEFLGNPAARREPASFDEVYDIDRWARSRAIELLQVAA
jgi:1-deoxy-D-xylulose-5-phosphate reductoisomerase